MKMELGKQDIQKTLPPMSDAFEKRQLDTMVWLSQKKEEPVMKRKISTAFVLAVVLIVILSAAALAVVLWKDTGEKMASMEAEKGFFESWQVNDKVTLIRLLTNAGEIEMTADVEALLSGKLSDEDANQLAPKLMTEYTSLPEDAVTLVSVLEALHGQMVTWAPEDKAWYRALLEEYGMLSSEDVLYELPSDDAISEAAAIQIAKETITKEYQISSEVLDAYTANTTYHVPDWEIRGHSKGQPIWNIEFVLSKEASNDDAFHVYMVEMTKDGTVLGHITNANGTARDQLDQWVIEKGAFMAWSWGDQAAYSERLAQLVKQDQLAGIEPDGYVLAISQTGFGIPGAGDMQEQEAIQIAKEYAKSFYGATEKWLEKLRAYTSFDTTNVESPIWRVKLLAWTTGEDWSSYESTGYVIHVNSKTGEVAFTLNRATDNVNASDLI